jgi:hypothetical protein
LLLAALVRCTCGTDLGSTRFSCTTDGDCADGYVCSNSVCATPGTAPDSGAGDGGASDSGRDAGGSTGDAGSFLLILSGPDAGVAGTCLFGAASLEKDGGAPYVVASPTAVALASSVGLGLYSDVRCTTSTSTALIPGGGSSAPFHYQGTKAGAYQISASINVGSSSASAPPLAVSILAGPPAGLSFTTASHTMVQEGCALGPSTVAVLDAFGNATTTPTGFVAGLTASPAGTASFYQDVGCKTPLAAGLNFAPGAASASLFFFGLQAGTSTITVDAGAGGAASQAQTVLSNTRFGTCQLAGDAGAVTCAYPTGQQNTGHTLYVFQALGRATAPDYENVSCAPLSGFQIACHRAAKSGVDANADIQWETLEHPGLTVQHVATQCAGAGAWTANLAIPVNPAAAFVLKSNAESGATESPLDFYAAQLLGATQVSLASSAVTCAAGSAVELDVVEIPSAAVTRGMAGPLSTNTLTVSGVGPITPASTALLFSYRVAVADGGTAACDRMVDGQISSATSLTFTRGFGADGGCASSTIDISWELVDFKTLASVLVISAGLDAGQTVRDYPLSPPVDLTRTIALSTGQGLSGQGTGAGSSVGPGVGDLLAAFTFPNAATLRVTRASGVGPARWTVQLVELH